MTEVPKVYIDGQGWRRVDELSLEMKLGRPIRPEFEVHQMCNNPTCVNPEHLFEVPKIVICPADRSLLFTACCEKCQILAQKFRNEMAGVMRGESAPLIVCT